MRPPIDAPQPTAHSPTQPTVEKPTPPPASPSAPQNSPKHPIGENILSGAGDVISAKQRVAIELLTLGKPLSQVAADCGVDRKTLYTWRHNRDFLAALRAHRRELWGDVADQIRALLPRAVGVLARQLDDRYDRARFDAARAILRLVDVKSAVAFIDDEGDDGDDANDAA